MRHAAGDAAFMTQGMAGAAPAEDAYGQEQ